MQIIGWLIAFTFAITFHEAAHAWMSDRLGDPTARLAGRISLNPLVHYDPIGTTLLLVLVILRALGAPVIPFGWAKPVGFDPYNLKNPRRDSALISLAGPLSNLLVAAILAIIVRIASSPFSPLAFVTDLVTPTIILCVVLAVFNLIPIHPLDGGKIFIGLLPESEAREADMFLRRYGMLILFLLIFPTFHGTSPIFFVIEPVINFILRFLLPSASFV
jgi:Zn-dependent protease